MEKHRDLSTKLPQCIVVAQSASSTGFDCSRCTAPVQIDDQAFAAANDDATSGRSVRPYMCTACAEMILAMRVEAASNGFSVGI